MAGLTALQGLRNRAQLKPGQKVLIVGASGGVGTFAVQIAALLEAQVTAVCSTNKAALARELRANQVIDYTTQDFLSSGERYELIFAINGYRSIWDYRRALAPGGLYLMAGGEWPQIRQAMLWGPVLSLFGSRRFAALTISPSQHDLSTLCELVVSGKIRPVIDRRFPLSAVPDAIRYVETGHAVGKVIIEV